MVQGAPARPCERAAENPQRQAPRPLPVLRTPDELPQHLAVLSASPAHLARMAEPPYTGTAADVGTIYCYPAPVSVDATSGHTLLGGRGEARLKNPLREICTAGSVRGETLHWVSSTRRKLGGSGEKHFSLPPPRSALSAVCRDCIRPSGSS